VHEATIEKKAPAKQQPYQPRKPQTKGRERENVPPRHDFVVELKDLIAICNIVERLKIPPKIDKKLGPLNHSITIRRSHDDTWPTNP